VDQQVLKDLVILFVPCFQQVLEDQEVLQVQQTQQALPDQGLLFVPVVLVDQTVPVILEVQLDRLVHSVRLVPMVQRVQQVQEFH